MARFCVVEWSIDSETGAKNVVNVFGFDDRADAVEWACVITKKGGSADVVDMKENLSVF